MRKKQPKKLKILSISHYYALDNRGGGEVMLHEMLKSLVDAGHKVDAAVTWTEGLDAALDGVKVYRGRQNVNLISKKYDVVITQFHEADNVIDKCKKLNIPTVFIVHNTFENAADTLKKKPSLAVFNTHWVRAHHRYQGNSIVVHPPVYAEQHATIHGDKITLVNLIESKGSNMFYNLAIRMRNTPFLGVEGGYYKEQQQIHRFNNVEIQPNTSNMKEDVWSKTKILLMPSMYESYGMVGVEALASGIPVIACPTPGLVESLGDGGIFMPDTKIITWMNEIRRLNDPENYAIASQNALKRSNEIKPKVELKAFVKEVEKLAA